MPEWLKGADCKSAGGCLRRFESFSLHQYAGIAQLVEHHVANVRVASSSLVSRSNFKNTFGCFFYFIKRFWGNFNITFRKRLLSLAFMSSLNITREGVFLYKKLYKKIVL